VALKLCARLSATGAAVNRYFPLACDTPSGYRVLVGAFLA
jgi:hypothetical protein